jgi:cation:H+ antiporter
VAVTFLLFAVSLIIILLASELFTNGVEWFGHRLNLGEGAVGSIFAAIGTALPETIIPIIAIVFANGASGESIGIGAIIGSSFMLATLAMFVVGIGIFIFSITRKRSRQVRASTDGMSRDLSYFLLSYGIALIAALLPMRAVKIALAVGLIGIYANYVRVTIKDSGEKGEDLRPLYLHKKGLPPHWRFITLQLAVALSAIILGADLFIKQVVAVSEYYAIPALILSLLITPIATELPEKFNSLIWVRKNKDTLAIGNITGAMVFQSTFLPMFGIFLTPWHLTEPAIVAAALGILASIVMVINLRIRGSLHAGMLIFSGLFYFAFILYVWLANGLGEGFITRAFSNIF